jgi:hypothetical protein
MLMRKFSCDAIFVPISLSSAQLMLINILTSILSITASQKIWK